LSARRRWRECEGRNLDVKAEINVTSLIDVAFTLLVIFIITAPILQGGIQVRLPQAQVQPLAPSESPFILNVIEDGTVVVGETPVSPEEFEEVFPQLFEVASPSEVIIGGDSLAIYGRILPVIGVVAEVTREAGVPWRLLAQELPPR
jgi:biopolymer transport protein TolR